MTLRKLIEKKANDRVFAKGFYELVRVAFDLKIVKEEDLDKMHQWSSLRNRLVHSDMSMEEQLAISVVTEVTAYTAKLRAA